MAKLPISPVSKVLNKVLADLGLDKRLREHTFMTLWPTFLSAAIAERSRPLFIDAQGNLVVSVADAATGQELSMIKGKILSKVMATARSLNIDIRGLRLDMKHYHAVSTMPRIEQEQPLPKPEADDLLKVELTSADRAAAAELVAHLSADPSVPESLRDRLVAVYELELRLRRWRFLKGFPVCPACLNPVERLHRPESAALKPSADKPCADKPLCLSCLFEDRLDAASGGVSKA